MTVWLYQMNAERPLQDGSFYTPDDFREDVESEEYLEWLTREIRPKEMDPKAGDTILYWFVVSGTNQPGLYGLGVIFDCYECLKYNTEYNCIYHLPVFPSEILSDTPIYDDEIQEIVDEIRGNQKNFATMFAINDDYIQSLFARIQEESSLEEE
ncbi:MAG: hypothetical protein HC875_19620 [Anaerolineales bacterium]|nr:hypothetical protein [Anaerolineales bacterium]